MGYFYYLSSLSYYKSLSVMRDDIMSRTELGWYTFNFVSSRSVVIIQVYKYIITYGLYFVTLQKLYMK